MKVHQNKTLCRLYISISVFIIFPFKTTKRLPSVFTASVVMSMRIACFLISVTSRSQNYTLRPEFRGEFRKSCFKSRHFRNMLI